MTAMTPFKELLGQGLALFVVDMGDHRQQIGTATDPAQARWILSGLSLAHNRPAYYLADDTAPREDVSWTPSED